MSAVTLKRVNKWYGTFRAVHDLSLDIAPNRVVGFLGPNGAGKTTTIRMLVGLSAPTSGEISIAGQSVRFGEAKTNSLFGYLPEQPAFYGWMTGLEYLQFVGDIFGLPRFELEKRIAELLKLTELKDASHKKISTYSNGMKQRLGIAQALINRPKVLIMDEPVSALDPLGRREVLTVIEHLKKEMTIIFSTHILSDVDRICDDVAIIDHGHLLAFSSLADLKSKYATPILNVECGADPKSMTAELKKQRWVKKLEKSGNHLKVWLKDELAIQKNEPLKFLAKQSISILNYGLSVPETEDLFMSLVEENR